MDLAKGWNRSQNGDDRFRRWEHQTGSEHVRPCYPEASLWYQPAMSDSAATPPPQQPTSLPFVVEQTGNVRVRVTRDNGDEYVVNAALVIWEVIEIGTTGDVPIFQFRANLAVDSKKAEARA